MSCDKWMLRINKLTFLLLQIPYHLMPVLLAVLAAGDVEPEVFFVCGLQDELVEVAVGFNPVEPAAGFYSISRNSRRGLPKYSATYSWQ